MPVLTICRHFTTRPFAGDDLQIICIILGAYRLTQTICLIPLIVETLLLKFSGYDLLVNGYPFWCPQAEHFWNDPTLLQTLADYEESRITRSVFLSEFVLLTSAFLATDVMWIVMVWTATSVGSPTQPNGRDEYLRKLILFKMCIIDILPFILVIFGCLTVHRLRISNYGCDDQPLVEPPPDSGVFYNFFCALIVSFAIELFLWPAIITNKIMRLIRSNEVIRKGRYTSKARGERLEQCLGVILKCISVCFSSALGGKELKNQGEIKDFTYNLMEFINNDTTLGLVFSDMYVGLMLLARVQAERRYKVIMHIQHSSKIESSNLSICMEKEEQNVEIYDRRARLSSLTAKRRRFIPTLQNSSDEEGFIAIEKKVLTSDNSEDVEVLRQAGHFSIYAKHVYDQLHKLVVTDFLPPKSTSFIRDFSMMEQAKCFSLAKINIPNTYIFYANVYNGIAATPYSILVDEDEKSVIITIRGSVSLEDFVIDAQFVPQPLDEVGKLCGFVGEGHLCHEGVLTRCKWMYNDIKRSRVLKQLFSDSSAYRDYDLVVVGHSLGGGCAQVLSLMLRPSFPSLRCFAYEPPGFIFDDLLCEESSKWIVSVIRHDDLVPRFTQHNVEKLRDELINIIARIQVPKYQAFHDIWAHCPVSHLAARNAKVLCPKHLIDRDTEFYKRVQAFRNERATKNKIDKVSVKLYIPGRIMHLVDTTGDETKYVPYWDSRYDFNQVILSRRMISDHDPNSLPDILQQIKLDDCHQVHTWDALNNEENEDSDDVFFIIPCSNPQGKLPIILLTLIGLACVLLSFSIRGCKFVSRTSVMYPIDGTTPYPVLSPNTGLWSYNLVQCIDGKKCTEKASFQDSHYVDTEYCYPYAMIFDPNPFLVTARACACMTILVGLLGFVFVSTATCVKLKKQTWCWLCAWFLLATLFQGLQFLILKGDVCSKLPGFESEDGTIVSQCRIARDGYIGMAAVFVWFATAVGCSHLARRAT